MPQSDAISVLVLDDRPIVEVLLVGLLDHSADRILEEVVTQILIDPQVRCIEVDVAALAVWDACGVTALFRACQHAANFGVCLRLVRVGPHLHRLLDCCDLWRVLADPD